MVDLKKEESYVYLIMVDTRDKMGLTIDYDVIPFKSEEDVKNAMLNIIDNNIRNCRDSINYVTYESKGIANYFAYVKIEYKSFKSKTYKAVRRKIHEVTYSYSSSKGDE